MTTDLTKYELFDGLGDAATAELGERFSTLWLGRGELVYSPFDAASAMYMVSEGCVRPTVAT